MSLNTRRTLAWPATAVLTYFLLTAPAEAADLTRHLLAQAAAAADSGIVFLHNLGT